MMFQKIISIISILLLGITAGLFWSDSVNAITPKQMYIQAEGCYKQLRHSRQKQKFRHNWLRCIDKFERVYRLEPSGPWAAAGLYQSGKLYRELAKHSGKKSDVQKAHDIFARIVRLFPKSRYKVKASSSIDTMPRWVKTKSAIRKDDIAKMIDAESKTISTVKQAPPQKIKVPAGGLGTVDDLRFWSALSFKRVVHLCSLCYQTNW